MGNTLAIVLVCMCVFWVVLNFLQQRQNPHGGGHATKRGGGGDPLYNAAGMRMTAFEELRENSREMKKQIMGQHVTMESGGAESEDMRSVHPQQARAG